MTWYIWANYTTFLSCSLTHGTIMTCVYKRWEGGSATFILAQGQYHHLWLTMGKSPSPQHLKEASPEQLCRQRNIYNQQVC